MGRNIVIDFADFTNIIGATKGGGFDIFSPNHELLASAIVAWGANIALIHGLNQAAVTGTKRNRGDSHPFAAQMHPNTRHGPKPGRDLPEAKRYKRRSGRNMRNTGPKCSLARNAWGRMYCRRRPFWG